MIRIVQKIEDKIKTIDALHTIQDIIAFAKKTSNILDLTQEIEDICNEDGQCDKLLNDMKQFGHSLTTLFDNCINENKTLRVLGL